MAEPDPTLRDVLTELRAHSEKLASIDRHLTAHGAKLEALTREVETLGRDTRELKAELLTELPPAVVTAVDRRLGERVRDLERDVAELKR